MKLTFGDLKGKEAAIIRQKEFAKFEKQVERAMAEMHNFLNLPPSYAGIHDFPQHLQHHGVAVLREACKRISQNRLRTLHTTPSPL